MSDVLEGAIAVLDAHSRPLWLWSRTDGCQMDWILAAALRTGAALPYGSFIGHLWNVMTSDADGVSLQDYAITFERPACVDWPLHYRQPTQIVAEKVGQFTVVDKSVEQFIDSVGKKYGAEW